MDTFTDQEFEEIISKSFSYAEALRKLGYKSNSGDATARLKNKIEKLKISTNHFSSNVNKVVRTENNVFCENSTADQSTLRRFYLKKYPQEKCSICGQITEWNNLKLILILDHINGNNHDNREENLRWVCPNCNSQLSTTNARNPFHKKYYCPICGKQVSGKGKKCVKCSHIEQQKVKDRPTREQLKELIRNKSFLEIGKQYSVSDNAIRKWCKTYCLPDKKTIINKMSQEEWEEI